MSTDSVNALPAQEPSISRRWWEGLKMAVGLAGQMVLAPFYGLYQAWLSAQRHTWNTPRHIGIIMDGNRRFARARRMLSPMEGHRKGADKLDEVLNWLEEAGVKVVSVWIFSMDNFKRDPSEVEALMDLFQRKFTELVSQPRIHANEIRVRFLGKVEALPENVRQAIAQAEDATRHYTRRTLNVGVAYGGREEIVDAFRAYLSGREKDGASLEQIQRELTPASIEPYLYTSGMPDPDLIIRTSGEVRLSGFLLWQSVYSEFYFCDTNWPAFRKIDLLRALREYHRRQRRFGR